MPVLKLVLFVEVKIVKHLMSVMVMVVVATMVVTLACESAVAQDQRPDRGGRGRGGFGGRGGGGDRGPGGRGGDRPMGDGGFDIERMTEMRLERFHNDEALGFSEEEWTVISPRLKSVLIKQTEAFTRGFGGGRGRDRGGQEDDDSTRGALRSALEDEDTPAGKIETLLNAHRKDVKKKQDALKKAQTELRDVLSIRQEAYFVLRNILE